MYFDFDYYKDKKVAIHCSSKTQAKKFCKLMHKNGMKWWSGENYNQKNRYQWKNSKICYLLNGMYCDVAYAKSMGYIIIEFEDIITGKYDRRNKMFTKKDLKNGDCVLLRNGDALVVINDMLVSNTICIALLYYNDDLTEKSFESRDIVKVSRGTGSIQSSIQCGKIVYERKDQRLWNGMTYEEAHRRLWNALADGEVKSKKEWFDLNNKNKEDLPLNKCFACESGLRKLKDNKNICAVCPINRSKCMPCLDGLYEKWEEAKGFEKFKLAHEIAKLPWEE